MEKMLLQNFDVIELNDTEQREIIGGNLATFLEKAVTVTVKTIGAAAVGFKNGVVEGYNYVMDLTK